MYRYLLHHLSLSFLVYSLRLIVLCVAGFDWTAFVGGHLSLSCRILYHVCEFSCTSEAAC